MMWILFRRYWITVFRRTGSLVTICWNRHISVPDWWGCGGVRVVSVGLSRGYQTKTPLDAGRLADHSMAFSPGASDERITAESPLLAEPVENRGQSSPEPGGAVNIAFVLLFAIWFPQKAWLGPLLLLVVVLLPFVLSQPMALLKKPKEQTWRLHLLEVVHAQWHYLKQILFSIVIFPYEAWLCADSIIRSLWRLLVSHRHLLQWQTAEEADRTTVNTLMGFFRQMWFSPLFAISCFLLVSRHPELWVWLSPFILVWLVAPGSHGW